MEKLEKEGMISYESSPVNTDINQEEDLGNNKIVKENNSTNLNENLNIEIENEKNEISLIKNKQKDKSLENNKIDNEVRESIFLQTPAIKGNRKSLFRGDIFDLEFEDEKKVNFIFKIEEKQIKIYS